MTCTYDFTGPNGEAIRLTGKPALKSYLASGGLQFLLPDRAAAIPSFRRTAVQTATSPEARRQTEMVERMAKGIAARTNNPPELVVFTSMQDPRIPAKVREQDQRQREGGAKGEVEGFYVGGTVYLNASQIKTPEQAATAYLHESFGHFGLRGTFGPGLNAVLDQLVALRKTDVLAKAKEYGLDVKDPDAMRQAAEEVLSVMAQNTPTIGFVKRAVAAIRAWLRQNVPGMSAMEISDAEIIRSYILPARAFVEQGSQAGRDMAANAAFSRTDAFKKWFGDSKVVDGNGKPMTLYHGTDAEAFNEFDASDFGSWFGEQESTAETYQEKGGEAGGTPRIYEVFLKIEKPLYVPDNIDMSDDHSVRDILKAINDYNGTKFTAKQIGMSPSYEGVVAETVGLNDRFTQAARDAGFDGINALEQGASTWSVFEPNQIKSATGNNGNFDATNPDIRFSRSPVNPVENTGLTPPEQGILRRVQSALQNNMNRVRQVQDRIEKLIGHALPEHSDYYGAETNRPGRVAARLEDAKNTLTGPLMEKLAKSGNSIEQLGELLHAMHARERNEAIARINPDMPDGGSGMMTADADALLAKYASNRILQALANDARAIARQTLELKRAYGLIDADTYTALATAYANYVPLKGDGEFGVKIKRAMGHEGRDEQIIENIARDHDQAIQVGEKNIARQSLLSMVLENPDPDLWTVGIPPRGRYIAGKVYSITRSGKVVATFTSEAQVSAFLEGKGAQAVNFEVKDSNGERVQQFVKPLQDNEVMVYLEGQGVRIQIKDDKLASQLRPLNQGQMHPILEFMRGTNRYLSKIYTGYNPAFIFRNAARDALTGTVNILGTEGAGTVASAWAAYPASVAALSQWAATGKTPSSETGKYLTEYRMSGGKVGASWMSDLEAQGKTLQAVFEDAYGPSGFVKDGRVGKAAWVASRKIVGGMAHVVEIANQATENGLRLALFIALRKQGRSAGEAAQAAKTVTVDFDRKGSFTGALGGIYLFFNPAVQGTANAIKTLVKGKNREQAWVALGAIGLLGVYAAGQGMDDDKDRWLGEGWDSRTKNFMLNIGTRTIKVPISQEFAPIYALGVAMQEAKRGEGKMKAAGHIVSSFIDAYFPLQGLFNSESDNMGLDAMSAAIPTILKPAFQITTNRNSFGSQVVPDSPLTADRPDNLKMFRGSKGGVFDKSAQGIAGLGELTGAGKYENDITKVSPETLKMLWRTYTGGLGQFITDTAGLAILGVQDPSGVETTAVPIIKDFVKANDVKAIRGRFYDLTGEARAAATEFAQAKKAGDGEAMDEILGKPEKAELLGLTMLIRSTTKAAGALRDEMIDVNADESLSLAEKRAKLKELEQYEEALYRDAIGAFR